MSRHRARPTRTVDPVALAVLLACLALSVWAVLGMRSASAGSATTARDFGPVTRGSGPAAGAPVPRPSSSSSTGDPAPNTPGPAAPPRPAGPVGLGAAPPEVRPAGVSEHQQEALAAEADRPTRIVIDAMGIDAPVVPVGVAEDGQMEIPPGAATVGWYQHGPVPGSDAGSVVLASHVDDAWGRPGVFAGLGELAEGDLITIEDGDATQLTYEVLSRTTVAKDELALDQLFERTGPPRLVLVTCTGPWSPRTGHYVDNLAVTAVPVEG